MRIAIDMQGTQGSGRLRGIGRYTLALTEGLIRMNAEHEIILVASGLFPDTIAWMKSHFLGKLPQENIRIWSAPGPVDFISGHQNAWRRNAAELLREAFLASLNPDIVLISSMIEGIGDNSVTSVGKYPAKTKVAAITYDLIPLLNQEMYLANPVFRHWYMEKLSHLRNADLLLAISESSRREAIDHAQIPEDRIVNISTAADQKFHVRQVNPDEVTALQKRIGIEKPFVFYCGGSDARKNLPRLISAYAALPGKLRRGHQLLFTGTIPQHDIAALKAYGEKIGLSPSEMIITGYLDDNDIILLYQSCRCFVLPSWHEGFGLPALEAMSCGAPVIGSNTSSIPEVIGNPEALFDPFNEQAISKKIAKVLADEKFRLTLIHRGLAQCKKFSWDLTARRTLAAFESLVKEDRSPPPEPAETIRNLIREISRLPGFAPDQSDLLGLATAIDSNFPELISAT